MTTGINKKLEALDNELTAVLKAHVSKAKEHGQLVCNAELVGVLETIKIRIHCFGLATNAEVCNDSSNS